MKKIYPVLIVCAAVLPVWGNACDICGCGAGNSYIGILPDFTKHIFGLRYRYNAMLTHVGAGGVSTYLTTKERYNTVEAWGGWTISGKFRVMANVPYNFNERMRQAETKRKNGLGDISVSVFYQLVNNRKTAGANLLVQSLWVGGAVKLPTGHYNPQDKTANGENANLFQLGTGSTDFSMNAMYDIRLQDVGLNINGAYKLNTTNRYDYRYGNKASVNAQVYYKFRINNKLTLAPNAGVQFETAANDRDNGLDVSVSGGNLLMATFGGELVAGKLALGGNFQTPVTQHLANGIVQAQNRVMLHAAIAF